MHVGHVVDHVVRTLSPMAKRGIVMEKAVTKQLPPIVADERRVIQVLSNLLSNALKFTERGKVSISVRADRGGRNVVVKIVDTGCGIPKTELKNLLVPFKQVDMSVGRKYGGTGLGLSIANQLVQAHSGSLELHSGEGEGTTVVVKLPVLQPETRPMLEAPFKLAYTSAGYDYESLVSPEAAKAEGRRLAVFRNPVNSLVRGWALQEQPLQSSIAACGSLTACTAPAGEQTLVPDVVLPLALLVTRRCPPPSPRGPLPAPAPTACPWACTWSSSAGTIITTMALARMLPSQQPLQTRVARPQWPLRWCHPFTPRRRSPPAPTSLVPRSPPWC